MASTLSLFARPRLSPGYLTRLARGRCSTFAQRNGPPSLSQRRTLATSVHMQPVSARNPAAVISFDRAIEAYVRQRGDSHGALSDALTVEPGLVPALALRVALQVFDSTSSVDDATVALQRAVDAPIASATPRERAIATGARHFAEPASGCVRVTRTHRSAQLVVRLRRVASVFRRPFSRACCSGRKPALRRMPLCCDCSTTFTTHSATRWRCEAA